MTKACGIVALLTDYGQQDGYAGIMKGAILSANPKARIIDLTHDIPPQDIAEGGRVLAAALPHFPDGTVFVAVIDPGVGSDRAILGVETDRHWVLAPDNGLLTQLNCWGRLQRIVSIRESKYFRKPVSRTFHGRDIFAPVAGLLSKGGNLSRFGPTVNQLEHLPDFGPHRTPKGWQGKVVSIDRFGNLITDIPETLLPDPRHIRIAVGRTRLDTLSRSYSEARKGGLLAIVGSTGYLEISVNQGNASKSARVRRGDRVLVTRR